MKTSILLLLVTVGFGAWLANGLAAQEKPQEVVLQGKITCAKCELELTKKCASVIVVKEAGKEVVYYFDAKANKQYHAEICSDAREGEVTGIVSEADGKKIITVSKLKFK